MSYVVKRMPSFEGVAAGGTAVCRLPIGLTYHNLSLELDGQNVFQDRFALNGIDEIRLIGNGQIVQRFPKGVFYGNMLAYDGFNFAHEQDRIPAAGNDPNNPVPETGEPDFEDVIPIVFDRLNLITRAGRELTQVGTGLATANPRDPTPLTTLQLEVDLNENVGANFRMEATAYQSASANLGVIKKTRTFTYNVGGAGDYEIADLPKVDLINRIFFFAHQADAPQHQIKHLKLERDNYLMFSRSADLNYRVQRDSALNIDPDGLGATFDATMGSTYRSAQTWWGRPAAGKTAMYVFDPSELGYSDLALVTAGVNDMRFTLDMGAACTLLVVVEYVGGIDT